MEFGTVVKLFFLILVLGGISGFIYDLSRKGKSYAPTCRQCGSTHLTHYEENKEQVSSYEDVVRVDNSETVHRTLKNQPFATSTTRTKRIEQVVRTRQIVDIHWECGSCGHRWTTNERRLIGGPL